MSFLKSHVRSGFILLLSFAAPAPLQGTVYYVSPTGSLFNNGTSLATPYPSITWAASQMKAGDTCNIRAGTYRETVTVTKSGSAGLPITFQAYNPTPANPATVETVVISGADPIPGWTLERPNVYRSSSMPAGGWASLGDGNQVFQSDTMMPEARWPNAGSAFPFADSTTNPSPDWTYVDTAGYDAAGQNGWLTDALLPAHPDGYWVGAKLHIMLGAGWYMYNPAVTSYADATKTLVTDDNHGLSGAAYAMSTGNEYYLTGVKDEMDSPGEWFFDTHTAVQASTGSTLPANQLCFYSATTPVNVQVKTRRYGFNLSGRSFINLVNLQFFACTLDPTATLSSPVATDCVFDGLRMKYLYHSATTNGTWGLPIGSRSVLKNSDLGYSFNALVYLQGSDIRVFNNHIHDSAYIPTGLAAIIATGYGADSKASYRNLISHNTIHSTGHSAIGFPGRASIVEYNDAYDGMKMSTDGGVLYWAGDGGNGIVRYNLIHDTTGPKGHSGSGVKGLYYDNENSGWISHHNLIWNINGDAIHDNARYNFDHYFNNTCWNCSGWSVITSFNVDGETGTNYYNNLLGKPVGGPRSTWNQTDVRYNLTTDPFSVPPASVPPAIPNFQNLKPAAIAAGTVVPGITDGFQGSAPDIGAMESGGTNWTTGAGCQATALPVDPTYVMPTMTFANQIKDGSFESGTLANWTTAPGSNVGLIRSSAWYDTHLRSSFFGLQFGGGASPSEISQPLTGLLPNRRYQFYCGVQKTDPAAVVTIGVRSYGAPDVEFTVPTTGPWRQDILDPIGGMFTVPFVTGSASTTATVYVRVTRAPGSPVAPLTSGTFPTVAAGVTNLSNYSNATLVSPWYPDTGVYVDDLCVQLTQEAADPLNYRMPVVSYPFNEASGSVTAADANTTGKTMTLSGATFTPGRQGNALTFTAANQYATASSVMMPSANGSFTVAFWLKFNSMLAGEYAKPVYNAGWAAKGWHITAGPNADLTTVSVGMYIWSSSNSKATDSPATEMSCWLGQPMVMGDWTHVAYVFDRANGVTNCYRDGVLSSVATIPDGFADISIPTGLVLGHGISDGQMDDVQLWDYALSDSDIAAVATPDPTLALRYNFDEAPGATTAWDASGNGKTATLTHATFTPSKQGKGNALTLSGTSGSAATTVSPNVPAAAGSGSFSISCWVNLIGVGTNPRIASTNGDTLPAKGWVLGTDSVLNLRLRLFDTSLAEVSSSLSSGTLSGAWTHITYTIDRPNALITRYRNGGVDGTTTIPAGFGAVDTANILRLATGITNGKIDDFRLYQRVLSWQEVRDLPRPSATAPYYSGVADLDTVQLSSGVVQLTWTDLTSTETGFRIERKSGAGGSYAAIATVGANTTSWVDAGPFVLNASYFYRVIATGASGDAGASNENSLVALINSAITPASEHWKLDAAGSWADCTNWLSGTHYPYAAGNIATFDADLSVPRSVALGAATPSITVGGMVFNDPTLTGSQTTLSTSGYLIDLGANNLTLDTGTPGNNASDLVLVDVPSTNKVGHRLTNTTGKLVLVDNVKFTGGSSVELSLGNGLLAGSGNLTMSGSYNLIVSGDNSSYTGNVRIEKGTLQIRSHVNALGTGVLTLTNGGVLNLMNYSSPPTLPNNIILEKTGASDFSINPTTTTASWSGSVTWSGSIANSGPALDVNLASFFDAAGFSYFLFNYTGNNSGLTFAAGKGFTSASYIGVGNANALGLGNAALVTLTTDQTKQGGLLATIPTTIPAPVNALAGNNVNAAVIGATIASGTATYSGLITLNSNNAANVRQIFLRAESGSVVAFNSSSVIANGTSNGAQAPVGKIGGGRVELNGADSYLGTTVVRGGELVLGNNNALGAGTTTVSLGEATPVLTAVRAATCSGNYSASIGTFTSGTGNPGTCTGAVTTLDGVTLAAGDRVLIKDRGLKNGIYSVQTPTSTWLRATDLDSDAELAVGQQVTVTSGTVNAGRVYFQAQRGSGVYPGTLTLNTSPLDYHQDLLNPDVSLLSNGVTLSRNISVVANGSTGKSTLGGVNTTGTSTFAGSVTLYRNLTATAATGGSVDFSGTITGGFGLTKEGAGKVIFSTAKGYTGATTVSAGTLAINSTLASSGVTVAAGATLQGGGSISNSITVSGTLAPGNSIGTLAVGSAAFTSGGVLAVEADGSAAGSADRLNVGGNLNLTNAALNLTILSALDDPAYVIASYGTLTGTFASVANLPAGYGVVYNYNSLHQIALVQIALIDYSDWTSGFGSGFTATAAGSDPDGDGLTNLQEYAFGLDPTLGSSANPIRVPFNKSAGTFSYTRRRLALTTLGFTIQTSTTLAAADWATDAGAIQSVTATVGNVETVRVTLSPGLLTGQKRFVRVTAQ